MGNLAAAGAQSAIQCADSGRMASHSADGRIVYLPCRLPDAVSFSVSVRVITAIPVVVVVVD